MTAPSYPPIMRPYFPITDPYSLIMNGYFHTSTITLKKVLISLKIIGLLFGYSENIS